MADGVALDRHPNEVANEIRRWLASGRAQADSGAFCAWRDIGRDALAFEYPEITGYALTWLAGRRDPLQHELDAGLAAADWLVARLNAGDRSARSGWDGGAVYSFDLGMIAAGLMSFGALIDAEAYVDQGREIARALAGYIEAGELAPLAPDGPPSSRPAGWSTDGRVHMVKCVQALLLAGEADAAEALVGGAIAGQAPDGHFVTQPGDEFVMLHPHLYAVEGLWILAEADDHRGARDAATRATEWVWEQQLPTGGMPRWVSSSEAGPEQLDATSQAVRAALLLDLEPPGLPAAIDRLVHQAREDAACGYALVYRPGDIDDHLNVWVTMFSGQALELAARSQWAVRWQELV
jgi:hypothetical protein